MALRIGIGLWLAVIAVGFGVWDAYEATPGGAGPAAAEDHRPTGRPSLVVYAHPRCPCTRATLAELAEVLATVPPGVAVEVVFVRPAGTPARWERTESWDAAARLPGARVRSDVGGAEARRAGAETSGHVVARDATGKVGFRGGVTRARGRFGDSPGRRAVEAVLAGRSPEVGEAPVFGCPLSVPGSGCCSDSEDKVCK
jgi:hypothetical protein